MTTFTDIWTLRPRPAEGAVIAGDGFRITVLTERLLRLEYEPENRFRDGATTAVINRDFPLPAFEVRRGADRLTVETRCVRLEYDMKPFSPAGSVWPYGESEMNLKGTARTLDRANGAFLKPRAPGEAPEPLEMGEGLMSMDGFAVLDDSRSMGMDDQGNLLPADGVAVDLYLFAYGHHFKAALRDFYRLSGPIPAVPRYALGNWWSRYYCYTEKTYKALMERFAAEQVPLSVAVIDMNWHVTDIDPKYGSGWTGYTWDPAMFPDPKAMLAHLAYMPTLQAPRKVKPHKGIFLEFAPVHRRWDKPITDSIAYVREMGNNAKNLAYLKENLEVFPAKTTVVLEYWLDVSLASRYKKPAIELPWHGDVFRSDIETYASMGIRNITTFAVYMDSTYFSAYPDAYYLKEYGDALASFHPRKAGRKARQQAIK